MGSKWETQKRNSNMNGSNAADQLNIRIILILDPISVDRSISNGKSFKYIFITIFLRFLGGLDGGIPNKVMPRSLNTIVGSLF